jgi:hypothetical protein
LVTKVINILIPNQHAMILIIFKSYDDWGWLNAYDGWDKWVYNVMKKTLSNFPSKHGKKTKIGIKMVRITLSSK